MRVEPAPPKGITTRITYAIAKRRAKELPDPVKIFGYHPKLLFGYGTFEDMTARSHKVDEKLKLLAELKAGGMVGCEWCLDFGSALARKEGVTTQQLKDLPTFRDSDAYSPLEKLVLEYAEGITQTPAVIPDELFDALREHFDEPQLVELTNAIAIENYRARFNWAFGLGSQGYSADPNACAIPESVAAGNGASA